MACRSGNMLSLLLCMIQNLPWLDPSLGSLLVWQLLRHSIWDLLCVLRYLMHTIGLLLRLIAPVLRMMYQFLHTTMRLLLPIWLLEARGGLSTSSPKQITVDNMSGRHILRWKERWEAHCRPYSQCRKLRDAIQARGKEQFGIKPLVVNIITQEEANECEKKHMIFC